MNGRRIGIALWVGVWVANVLLAAVSVTLLRSGHVASAWRPAIAILPAVPLPFGLALFFARLSRMDEFRGRLTVGAFALASALVGIVVYGWSLLVWTGAGPVPTVWIFPAQLLLWGALMIAARLRYP